MPEETGLVLFTPTKPAKALWLLVDWTRPVPDCASVDASTCVVLTSWLPCADALTPLPSTVKALLAG